MIKAKYVESGDIHTPQTILRTSFCFLYTTSSPRSQFAPSRSQRGGAGRIIPNYVLFGRKSQLHLAETQKTCVVFLKGRIMDGRVQVIVWVLRPERCTWRDLNCKFWCLLTKEFHREITWYFGLVKCLNSPMKLMAISVLETFFFPQKTSAVIPPRFGWVDPGIGQVSQGI